MTLTLAAFLIQLLFLSQIQSRPVRTLTAANEGSPNAVECHNGSQLAAAFADSSVQVAYIMEDIVMADMDWATYKVPLVRWQNLTVAGRSSNSDDWPVLDLGFVSDKVVLAPGVVLELTHLGLRGWRQRPYFQAPAIDLLADGRGLIAQLYGSNDISAVLSGRDTSVRQAVVLMQDMAFIQRSCLPRSITYTSVNSLPRPPYLPGNQSSARMPLATDCLNTTTTIITNTSNTTITGPLLRRCWPATGRYWDLVTYAMMYDTSNQPVQAGYLLWWVNVNYLCETLMSELCACLHSALGCYYRMFPPPGIAPEPPEEPDEDSPKQCANLTSPAKLGANDGSGGQGEGGSDSGGSSDSSDLLAPLLGGLLGGLAFSALVAAAAFFYVRRRRSGPAAAGGSGKAGKEGSSLGDSAEFRALESSKLHGAGPGKGRGPGGGGGGAGGKGVSGGKGDAAEADPAAGPDGTDGGTSVNGTEATRSLSVTVMVAAPQLAGAGGPSHIRDLPRAPSQKAGGAAAVTAQGRLAGPPKASRRQRRLSAQPSQMGSEAAGLRQLPALSGSGGAGGGAGTGTGTGTGASKPRRYSQVVYSDCPLHSSGLAPSVGSDATGALSRCLPVELSLLPVTPLTPLVPGINFDARALATEVKLLPVTLGKGAFGRVLQGEYCGEPVAVKLLDGGLAPPPELQALFGSVHVGEGGEGVEVADGGEDGGGGDLLPDVRGREAWNALVREVEVLARCEHPNVVRLLAASLKPPRLCVVMELMDTSLDKLLYGGGAPRVLPLATVVHIAIQVARALAYLHPTVLHRDLKPANVLISQPHCAFPVAKLADFGVSRLCQTLQATRNTEVGTGPYIAPEAFDALNPTITDRAEIYAFGVILWEMLAAKRPWQGYNPTQIAFAVCMLRTRLPLKGLSPERCPPKLRNLIQSCWEADPARRPAAAEVVKALMLAQEALSVSACPSEGPASNDLDRQAGTRPNSEARQRHAGHPGGREPEPRPPRQPSVLGMKPLQQ